MRIFGRIALVGLCLLGTIAAPAAQWQGGRDSVGITVYEDRDFRGRSATFRDDVPDLVRFGLNDRIESLEVASGELWEVCLDIHYRGRCQVFSGGQADLRRNGWDKEISSMRRVRGGGGYYPPNPGWPGGRPPVGSGRGELRLYENRDFRGGSRTLTGPTPDLRALGFNDKAESLRLGPGEAWEICRDINYVDCRQVRGDAADLRRMGNLSGEVSSARPLRFGGGGGWSPGGPGYVGAGRIVLYGGQNYTGASYAITGVSDSVRLRQVQSVRVHGGNWQVCEDEGFRGRCTVVNTDVPNLRSFGLPGRVRSVRPVAQPR